MTHHLSLLEMLHSEDTATLLLCDPLGTAALPRPVALWGSVLLSAWGTHSAARWGGGRTDRRGSGDTCDTWAFPPRRAWKRLSHFC